MLSSTELEEWIRQTFFADHSEESFTAQIGKAQQIYAQVLIYFEEHGLEISLESLNAMKDKVLEDMAPSAEEIAQFGKSSTSENGQAPEHEAEEITLLQVDARLKSIEKKAFWIFIALFIIIILK